MTSFVRFISTTLSLIFLAGSTKCLNHGRDAKDGEFPYVVRVRISDLQDDARRVAAGVLISLTRVLTTCDTVGYFTGETIWPIRSYENRPNRESDVNLYQERGQLKYLNLLEEGFFTELSTPLLLCSSGLEGGQRLHPSSSSTHPWCHLLASEMVLFNLGFFIVREPGFTPTDYLKPVPQTFESKAAALEASYDLYRRKVQLTCQSAGWGYPTMAFEDKVEPDFFNSSSEILQATEMNVVPYEGDSGCLATTCKEFGDCLVNIWEYGLVCATAKRGGPCRNDRGAPLMCEGVFAGVLTNPQRCEDKGIPRHFVRVDLVYDYVFQLKSEAITFTAGLLITLSAVTASSKLTGLT